jgi:hypothetical protein
MRAARLGVRRASGLLRESGPKLGLKSGKAKAAEAIGFESGFTPECGLSFFFRAWIFDFGRGHEADLKESEEEDGEGLRQLEGRGAESPIGIGYDGKGEPLGQEGCGEGTGSDDEDEGEKADGVGEDDFGEGLGVFGGEEGESAPVNGIGEDEEGEGSTKGDVDAELESAEGNVDEKEDEEGGGEDGWVLEISHFG